MSGATGFNVYRGILADLGVGAAACHSPDWATASLVDPDGPPPGGGFYYLIAGVRCGVEGPLGSDSLGGDRAVNTCP